MYFKKSIRVASLFLAAALLLALAACGGKAGKSNNALQARFTALYESDALADMLAQPDQYAEDIAAYALEDFAGTFADADGFRSYTVEIGLKNANDFDVQILNVQMDAKNQGKDGVWFSTLNEAGTIGLPAQYDGDEAMYYYAIADAALSKEDVLRTLGGMGITCVYMQGSEAPDLDAQPDPALLFTGDILYAE